MNDETQTKYQELLQKMKDAARPVILLNAATHGDETIGKEVLEKFSSFVPEKGTLFLNVANEKALVRGTRYVDADLNRVFPGKEQGNYEERLAHAMLPVIEEADVVVDIHATNTIHSADEAMLIITKLDAETLRAVRAINPPNALLMKPDGDAALISRARVGLVFEYGSNTDKTAFEGIVCGIYRLFSSLGVSQKKCEENSPAQQTHFYEVFGTVPKTDFSFELCEGITNFSPLKKGVCVAQKGAEELRAEQDFIPILFGNNRYKDIFGFMAKKIADPDLYTRQRMIEK